MLWPPSCFKKKICKCAKKTFFEAQRCFENAGYNNERTFAISPLPPVHHSIWNPPCTPWCLDPAFGNYGERFAAVVFRGAGCCWEALHSGTCRRKGRLEVAQEDRFGTVMGQPRNCSQHCLLSPVWCRCRWDCFRGHVWKPCLGCNSLGIQALDDCSCDEPSAVLQRCSRETIFTWCFPPNQSWHLQRFGWQCSVLFGGKGLLWSAGRLWREACQCTWSFYSFLQNHRADTSFTYFFSLFDDVPQVFCLSLGQCQRIGLHAPAKVFGCPMLWVWERTIGSFTLANAETDSCNLQSSYRCHSSPEQAQPLGGTWLFHVRSWWDDKICQWLHDVSIILSERCFQRIRYKTEAASLQTWSSGVAWSFVKGRWAAA